MRILSIDFDYFVDADMQTRTQCFPDGNDSKFTTDDWKYFYNTYPHLKDIGIIKNDYDYMCELLRGLKGVPCLVSDTHKDMEKLFRYVSEEEDLELINVDFHHDMFVTGGNSLDCGNWLRFLVDLKPNANITWVRREDSDVNSLFGEFPYRHTTDIKEIKENFDYVFLCFSSPWSPPHLYEKFVKMCDSILR